MGQQRSVSLCSPPILKEGKAIFPCLCGNCGCKYGLLAADRVRYREAVTPLSAAACKHFTAVGSFHPLAEAMLVDSLPV